MLVTAAPPSGQLLRKEKDEASPPDVCRRNSLNAFIPRFCRSLEVFLSPDPALVSNQNPFRAGPELDERSAK
jgi:hypothetical protein